MPRFGSLHFNWIDIVVVVLIIRGVYVGYKRGLSGEVLRFLGIVIALILASKFYEAGADRLISRFDLGRRAASACSFAGISIVVIFFFYCVNRMVRRMMDLPLIATVEKGGGAILGGARALLVACVALIILALVRIESVSNAVSRGSYFGSLAISAVPGAYRLAVRVYPEVEKSPAREVIEKLPAVEPTAAQGRAEKGKGEAAPKERDYITP